MITGVVFTALRSLVSDRCYPTTFMQPDGGMPTWPAIRYTVASTDPVADVCGTDDGETDDSRVQIDYVAKTSGAAQVLRDLGRVALATVDPPCVRDGGFETYDEATRTYRAVEDYVFYPSSEETS